jgi:hypothetical protein
MVGTAFVTFFFPVPGISVGCVAAVVLVAEAHRAIRLTSHRSGEVTVPLTGSGRTNPREAFMPTKCDVIVAWDATPEQLTAVGTALWRWCVREVGDRGIYQYLDNQALADLIAGRFPAAGRAPQSADLRGVHFRLWNQASHDGGVAIDALRREFPAAGVVDVLVDGTSWKPVG